MISKNKARFIISLQKKKVRDEEGLYIIEGDKLVREFMFAKVPVKTLIAKKEFISSLSPLLKECIGEIVDVSYEELKQISTLKTPHNALAVIPIPERILNAGTLLESLCVALDFVQDPGNLGTIIRAAAWFGIKNIICSHDCVDVYNPKVVQASMGAILHVNVYYADLINIAALAREQKIPVYGTLLEGESIYREKLGDKGLILMGNESRGISEEIMPFITHKIMIPPAASAKPGIDSLNVSMAASVVFSEFLRQISIINK
ncbi:MAG: RNA methyltransferase [Bacteroidales bacterium]|nr:RNA methyltransferase [Bacteroidales bacterium]